MINKQITLRGISKAKYMHYANIVVFDESGIDFLRELFSRTISIYLKVSDERVRN